MPHILAQGLIGEKNSVDERMQLREQGATEKERTNRGEKIRQESKLRNKLISATVVGESANNPTGKNQ